MVGAATGAPVGAYVSSFRVIAALFTMSCQRPRYRLRWTHACQKSRVASKSAITLACVGAGSGASPVSPRVSTTAANSPCPSSTSLRTSLPCPLHRTGPTA